MNSSKKFPRKQIRNVGRIKRKDVLPSTKRLAATLLKQGAALGNTDDAAPLRRLFAKLSELGAEGSNSARLSAWEVLRDQSAVAVLFDMGPTLRSHRLEVRTKKSAPKFGGLRLRRSPKRSVTYELQRASVATEQRPVQAAVALNEHQPVTACDSVTAAARAKASEAVKTSVIGYVKAANRDELASAVESLGLRVRGYGDPERSVLASRPLRQPPMSPALLQLTRATPDAFSFEIALRWTGDTPEIPAGLQAELRTMTARFDDVAETD